MCSVPAACHSLKALHVILACVHWVFFRMVFIASLKALKHFGALWLSNIEGSTGKVGSEEVSERWHLRCSSSECTEGKWIDPDVRSWWGEKSAVAKVESLHVRVFEVAGGHDVTSLEGVSDNHEGMGVV